MPPTPMHAEPRAVPAPLSVGSFVKNAWEIFKKRPWFFIAAILLLGLASGIINMFGSIVEVLVDGNATSGLGHLLSFLISLAANILIGIGSLSFFLKAHDSPETVTFYDAWRPEFFWKYVATYLLFIIIVWVGFILLIVPGIIASLAFGMALYLVVDKGMGPIEALKESARITKGNRWRLLALGAASLLIGLLGLICLIVGIFVAAPVVALMGVTAYRRIAAAADTGHLTPLSGGEKTLVGLGILIPIVAIAVGIIAAVTLATLSVAREKGQQASNEMQLKMLQLALISYNISNGAYPSSLPEMTAQLPPGANINTGDFTYVTDGKHKTYTLCAAKSPSQGTPSCVSSEDASPTATSSQ